MNMTKDEKEELELEIQHIFDSGANEIRIFEMVVNFIDSRQGTFHTQEPIDPPLQLTKLEHFSGLAMVGFSRLDLNYSDCAEYSVKSAKALIAELAKEENQV